MMSYQPAQRVAGRRPGRPTGLVFNRSQHGILVKPAVACVSVGPRQHPVGQCVSPLAHRLPGVCEAFQVLVAQLVVDEVNGRIASIEERADMSLPVKSTLRVRAAPSAKRNQSSDRTSPDVQSSRSAFEQ